MTAALSALQNGLVTVGRFAFAPRFKVVEVATGGAVHRRPIRAVTEARRMAEVLNQRHGPGTFRAVFA